MCSHINANAVKSDIRKAVINEKANACPMMVRLAWHASGTFSKEDSSGGSDGATMRFEPEAQDPANAGLSIARDILQPVKEKYPDLSYADLWTLGGVAAIEFSGGPRINHKICRGDAPSGAHCPVVGRLPDAAQGAQHLRDVFYRMGFGDREIVALSGAHTLGRCHVVRSGFDGPWTKNPLEFDNSYFTNLLNLKWTKKNWDGPEQYEDESGELMMLPTDLALVQDPEFRKFVELYAQNQDAFFNDFAAAFERLTQLGCKTPKQEELTEAEQTSAHLREAAMHGSLDVVKKMAEKGGDVHSKEAGSDRTALHKAAFWGHEGTVRFLVDAGVNVNDVDSNGDSALNDAAKFGHTKVVEILLGAKADVSIKNKDGKDAMGLASQHEKKDVVDLLKSHMSKV